MPSSNYKPRISLQFNEFDFRHRKVLEVLRARPRNMTDLVVNAILHFISCPNAEQEFDRETMKTLIREVVSEMAADGSLGNLPNAAARDHADPVDPDLGDIMAAFRTGK